MLDVSGLKAGERAGLIAFGEDYAWIGFDQDGAQRLLVVRSVGRAQEGQPESAVFSEPSRAAQVTVRVAVTRGAQFHFAVVDNGTVRDGGRTFQAKPGRWVGAKVGLFAAAPAGAVNTEWASFARFKVSALR